MAAARCRRSAAVAAFRSGSKVSRVHEKRFNPPRPIRDDPIAPLRRSGDRRDRHPPFPKPDILPERFAGTSKVLLFDRRNMMASSTQDRTLDKRERPRLPRGEAGVPVAPEAREAEQPGEEGLQTAGQGRAALRAGQPIREVRARRAAARIRGQAARVPPPESIIRTTHPAQAKISHRRRARHAAIAKLGQRLARHRRPNCRTPVQKCTVAAACARSTS